VYDDEGASPTERFGGVGPAASVCPAHRPTPTLADVAEVAELGEALTAARAELAS
jgi:hypothetical protein